MASTPDDGRIHPTKRVCEKAAGLSGMERFELMKSILQKNMQDYKKSSFTAREGDVFVVTFRKCGTTWMQQIVKLIRNRGREDGVDVDGALPWLELMSPEEADVRSALNSLSRAYNSALNILSRRVQSSLHDECACSCKVCMEGKRLRATII